MKPLLWVARPSSQVPYLWKVKRTHHHRSPQAKELAVYLSQVVQDRQVLSNKALHLFLQTKLTMEVLLIDKPSKSETTTNNSRR